MLVVYKPEAHACNHYEERGFPSPDFWGPRTSNTLAMQISNVARCDSERACDWNNLMTCVMISNAVWFKKNQIRFPPVI